MRTVKAGLTSLALFAAMTVPPAAIEAAPAAQPLPFPRITAGDSLRALGDLDRAEAEYRAGLEIAKNYQAGTTPREEGVCLASYGLARIAIARKQPGVADEFLEPCDDKPKFEPQYLVGQGLVKLAENKLDEAETTLIQAANRLSSSATPGAPPDPLRAEVAYTLVDIAEAKGVPGLAVNYIDEIIALSPKDPQPLIKKGRLLVITRQYDEALTAFSKAVQLDSTAVDAYKEVAKLFGRSKQPGAPSNAAKAWSRVVKYEPTAEHYRALGSAHEAAREHAEALAAYEEALKLEPASEAAQLGVGRNAFKSGNRERGIAAYKALKDQSVLTAEDHENIGRSYLDSKEYGLAREAYLKSVALDSTRVEARYYVGYAYFAEQKYAEAVPYFEERIAADSTWAPAYGNLGIALLQTGQAVRGIEMLERAVRVQPDDASSRILLAQALMSQSQWARAMTEYRSVLEREPQNADALRGLGYCLLIQERYNEALDALGKAHAAQPGHTQGMIWLAQAHGLSGQLSQAKSMFRQVLSVEPGNADAIRGVQEIEEIEKSGQKKKTKS